MRNGAAVLVIFPAILLGASAAWAGHGEGGDKASLETCLEAASEIKSGDFAKVEHLSVTDEGAPLYEIEVHADDGGQWEFECNARSGSVVEMEQEVDSTDDEPFAGRAEISEKEAIRTAKELYPGTVQEVEYEIESEGYASYEMDIRDPGGTEFKVEVDATTGEIVEVQVEDWEIGQEDRR